jgi:FixJ family two-component response regulator
VTPRSAAPLTVILVEDDEGMRTALARVLEIAGFKIASFASAEDCLAANISAEAGCAVCDVQLAGQSGFALARHLAQAGSGFPVIFITAHDSEAARAEAQELGAAAYLPKPFDGRALLRAVREATRGRSI